MLNEYSVETRPEYAQGHGSHTIDRTQRDDFNFRALPLIPKIKRYALKLTRNVDDADDLVQDVLLKVYDYRGRLNDIAALGPWMIRTAYNRFIDTKRMPSTKFETVSLDAFSHDADSAHDSYVDWDVADDSPEPDDIAYSEQLFIKFSAFIKKLSEKRRKILLLHYIQGHSHAEIASIEGISINTVKSTLRIINCEMRSYFGSFDHPLKTFKSTYNATQRVYM